MSNPPNVYQPAIDELEKDYATLERQGNALLSAINVLRTKAGLPPRPGGGIFQGLEPSASAVQTESATTPPAQLRSDTFYGKRMGTAVREFLEMRKAGGDGAAKTREIFDGLKAGGFLFETKDDSIAMVSLRNMLRKRTETFLRLPNGTYGLKGWYPHARTPKPATANEYDKSEDADLGQEHARSSAAAA